MEYRDLRPLGPFDHPEFTARGEPRAKVPFDGLKTLWFNTGTVCNIACRNCYIESTPRNDRLAYLSRVDVCRHLDEVANAGWPVAEIGFTGGEPFMNPEIVAILGEALGRGYRVLILTNGMRPMQRLYGPLLEVNGRFPGRLRIRVSLDHHTRAGHEACRGPRTWQPALDGLTWLARNQFELAVAGRTIWEESEEELRRGYADLFRRLGVGIDARDRDRLVLFPEMDERAEVPEISERCWSVLGVSPHDMMCATSRMVVKRKGADRTTVVACTLIAYDERFEMGETLAQAARPVRLNHVHCAKFCVLGGGSCSRA